VADPGGMQGVPEGHMLTLGPGVQVRSSGQELSGGQWTGHRLLRLTQGKKGEVVNRESGGLLSDKLATDKRKHVLSDRPFE